MTHSAHNTTDYATTSAQIAPPQMMRKPSLPPVAELAPSTPTKTKDISEPSTLQRSMTQDFSALSMDDSRSESMYMHLGQSPDLREARPSSSRSSTDPTMSLRSSSPISRSPRNRSPRRRAHGRSHSTSSTSSAPPMVRAHSSPAYTHSSDYRSSSPLRSPGRVRSPFRIPTEDEPSLVASPSAMFDIEAISEDAELDLTPRPSTAEKPLPFAAQAYLSPSPSSSTTLGSPHFSLNSSGSFRLGRRRPASPLHQVANAGFLMNTTPRPSSANSSPLLEPSRFNENFPAELPLHHARSFSSSSIPSTPTSARSRSPSISSLETIPDTPGAEAAAAEQDRIDRESGSGNGAARRGSLDAPGQRSGFGFGGRDKRKRWSVCGAERRSDLDLETIWED